MTDAFKFGFLGLWLVCLDLSFVTILLVEECLDDDGDVNARRATEDAVSDVIAEIFLIDDAESSCFKYAIELVCYCHFDANWE